MGTVMRRAKTVIHIARRIPRERGASHGGQALSRDERASNKREQAVILST